MALEIRPYREEDLAGMLKVWNEVVEGGEAFPQIEPLTHAKAAELFAARRFPWWPTSMERSWACTCSIRTTWGRCAHVGNASYAVASSVRGLGLGRALVEDSLAQAARKGFRGLRFNAVVAGNAGAIHLYEDLGFVRVGTVPGGFVNFMGGYEDIHIYYRDCVDTRRPC